MPTHFPHRHSDSCAFNHKSRAVDFSFFPQLHRGFLLPSNLSGIGILGDGEWEIREQQGAMPAGPDWFWGSSVGGWGRAGSRNPISGGCGDWVQSPSTMRLRGDGLALLGRRRCE